MKTRLFQHKYLLPVLAAVLLCVMGALILLSREETPSVTDALVFELRAEDHTETITAWSGNGTDFFLFLPSFSGTDSVFFTPRSNSPDFSLNGTTLRKGDSLAAFRLSQQYDLTVSRPSPLAGQYTLTILRSSGTASLFINTANGAMDRIAEDKTQKENASLLLLDESGHADYIGSGADEIKGRGNSSWTLEKKPYHLSLFRTAGLLGMNASRHWILLSNGWDRTNLRNKLVYDFARNTGLFWTPECKYVDIYLNGSYNGLYLLTEQIEFDSGKLEPAEPRSSFLVEITQEHKNSDSVSCQTDSGRNIKISEPNPCTAQQLEAIKMRMQTVEDAIFAMPGESLWPDHLDLDSFARRYLIDEIFANLDADVSSSYYYWDESAGQMFAGPIWDYDLSIGNDDRSYTARLRYPCHLYAKDAIYYGRLYQNEIFLTRVHELYEQEMRPLLGSMIDSGLDGLAASCADTCSMNSIRWAHMFAALENGSDTGEQKYQKLKSFLEKRCEFLDSVWIAGEEYRSVWFWDGDGKLLGQTALKYGSDLTSLPSPDSFGITDSDRWYLKDSDVPLKSNTVLTSDLNLCSALPAAPSEPVHQKDSNPEKDSRNGMGDYLARVMRHHGSVVISLVCLIALFAAMIVYAYKTERFKGGRR